MSVVTELKRWGPIARSENEDDSCSGHIGETLLFDRSHESRTVTEFKNKPCDQSPKVLSHTGEVSTLSFPGINNSEVTRKRVYPYSTSIAIGKQFILQTAITRLAIYTKMVQS
jgi:hypothetical protein